MVENIQVWEDERETDFPEGGNNLCFNTDSDLSGRCHGDQQNSSHSCPRRAFTQRHPTTLTFTHKPLPIFCTHTYTHSQNKCSLHATQPHRSISGISGLAQTLATVAASLPRMKGPALLALLPDIPGHCSLLARPDVSPAPLSNERRLDILELCRGIYLISTQDKDNQVKRASKCTHVTGRIKKRQKIASVIFNQTMLLKNKKNSLFKMKATLRAFPEVPTGCLRVHWLVNRSERR